MIATPSFGPRSRLSDLFAGLALPFRAVRLVFGNRKLFALSLIASAVTFVSLVFLFILLFTRTDDFVRSFVFGGDPATWYGHVGFWALVVVIFLLGLVVGANTVPVILLAPLQDPLSEATEEACGDFEAQGFSVKGVVRGTWVALAHTLARVALLMTGHALLLALNLIPAVGSLLWTATSILWTMVWLSAEYLDAPMARHLYAFRDVRKVVVARLPLCLGFGAAVYLMLWVPVLNLFFVPTAVVAGTLLFRGLRQAGSLGPPARAGAPGAIRAA